MIIGDIDYFVQLMVGDITEDDVPTFNFADFDAFNAFVRENAENPMFQDNVLTYTLVENMDGEPGYFMWTKEISFKEFTEEEIEEEIAAQLEFLEDAAALTAAFEEKEFRYQEPTGDSTQKMLRIQDITYVCPYCIREVHECLCEHYPYFLIQVDTLMVPIIRELNSKGYKTTGCCAGHPEKGEGHCNIYVAFDREYDFDEPLPEGARWSKLKHCLTFEAPCANYEGLVEFQSQTLYKLGDWAEMLFEAE